MPLNHLYTALLFLREYSAPVFFLTLSQQDDFEDDGKIGGNDEGQSVFRSDRSSVP